MIHAIYRDDELILALNGVPYTIDIDDPRYEDICDAVDDDDEELLDRLVSVRGRSNAVHEILKNSGIDRNAEGQYTYRGNPLPMDLSDYMLACIDRGSPEAVIRFVTRLYENPNYDTRIRLFEFMARNKMPIDSSGRFLAFKVVDADYKDKHTRTIDNSPGTTVPRMSWSEVDTDPTISCSRGYHACSIEYLNFFYGSGDRVVSVAIAPEDVGSIPDDYDGAKLRCRQYTVVKDITSDYEAQHQDTRLHLNGNDGVEVPDDYTFCFSFSKRDLY